MTYIHLFEAAEKIAEMQWPDTVTDAEAFKIIESSLGGGVSSKSGTDNLLVVRALTASGYRAEINRLLNADKLTFYDPLTRLKIKCNDASDPLLKIDELQELLGIELAALKISLPITKVKAILTSGDWKAKAMAIAQEIGLEKHLAGWRNISARAVCEGTAERLAADITTHGKQGKRSGDNVRNEGLKGWKFSPPMDEKQVD